MAVIRNVNPQEMLGTAKNLSGKIGEWNQLVNDIFAAQQELDGMWDGDANTEFNNQWAADREKYNKLALLLDEYCTAIDTAATLYIQKEEEVKNIVNG